MKSRPLPAIERKIIKATADGMTPEQLHKTAMSQRREAARMQAAAALWGRLDKFRARQIRGTSCTSEK